MNRLVLNTLFILSVLLCCSQVCFAYEIVDSIKLNGYLSQAAVYSSDNNFFGESDDSISFDYTELGGLAFARFSDDLTFSSSILFRRAGKKDNDKIILDHSYFSYSFINNVNYSIGSSFGKVKGPVGFYNETRDVAFTRPGIFLPQSLYIERFRNAMFSFLGVDLHGRFSLEGRHDIAWNILFSKDGTGKEDLEDIVGMPLNGDLLSANRPNYISRIIYDWNDGRFRLGLTSYNTKFHLENQSHPYTGSPVSQSATLRHRGTVFSGEYNSEDWTLSAEFSPIRSSGFDVAGLPDIDSRGYSYYLQAYYRLSRKYNLLFRRTVSYGDKDDKDGEKISETAGSVGIDLPGYSIYSKAWVFGGGIRFSEDILGRVEYYKVDGCLMLSASDNDLSKLSQKWEMIAAQISYRF